MALLAALSMASKPAYFYNREDGKRNHLCLTSWDCTGARTCEYNHCVGHPGYAKSPKPVNYVFDEGPTHQRCNDSMQCNGRKLCSDYGWCYGYDT